MGHKSSSERAGKLPEKSVREGKGGVRLRRIGRVRFSAQGSGDRKIMAKQERSATSNQRKEY